MRSNDKHLRQLVALQDRERRLLACEIHDGFVQDVMSAQLAIDALLERLLKTDRDSVEPLLKIRGLVRKAIDEARSVVGELRPPLVADLPIIEAIQEVIDQEEKLRRLKVEFTYDIRVKRFEPLLQSTIIRIVQESLNNVARHARSKDATVELSQVRSTIRVVISDRGAGFALKQIPADRHGLAGIRERARLFEGKASIRSRLGKGTTITVEFPFRKPK